MRRRWGSPTVSAKSAMVRGSSMSRRWATCDMVRWWATRNSTSARVLGCGSPRRAVSCADQRDALGHVAVALGLADVVQQHAQHQQLRLLHLVEHLGGALRFRRLPGGQRLQVLDGQQRVLVGRELVIDVVLHQAGQRAELRQVAARARPARASPRASAPPGPTRRQMSRKTSRDGGAAPEGVVDDVERVLDRPLEVGRRASQPSRCRCQKTFMSRRIGSVRSASGSRSARCRAPVEEHEPVGQRLLALRAARPTPRRDSVSWQRAMSRRDMRWMRARVQVVVAHEALDAEAVAVVLVAEVLGDPRLQVARQHVVLVAGQKKCSSLRTRQRKVRAASAPACSRGGDEPLVGQLAQGAGAELGRAQPHGGVHVAQAARRLLHVGLADVGRGAELAVALVALGQGRRPGTRRSRGGRRCRAARGGSA